MEHKHTTTSKYVCRSKQKGQQLPCSVETHRLDSNTPTYASDKGRNRAGTRQEHGRNTSFRIGTTTEIHGDMSTKEARKAKDKRKKQTRNRGTTRDNQREGDTEDPLYSSSKQKTSQRDQTNMPDLVQSWVKGVTGDE